MAVSDVQISDAELVDRFPRYRVDHDTKGLYRGWLDRRLLLNRCADCGRWHHPPKPICPACWSTAVVPTEVSGRGTVEQEALRFTSTVVECPVDELRIGMPVELTWLERDGAPFPAFRPAAS
jgi:uncharacterized OB-fold protein